MKKPRTGITLIRIPISRSHRATLKELWDLFKVMIVLLIIPTAVIWFLQVAECRGKNTHWTVWECSRPYLHLGRKK